MNPRRLACILTLAAALAPAAIARAEDPPAGASVNVCGAKDTGDIGVRVSAPYRGADVAPWVRITVQYYSDTDGAWHPASGGDSEWFQAGPEGTGAETGYTFPYKAPDAGAKLVMRGVVEIEWRPGDASRRFVTAPCEVPGAPAQAGAEAKG